jgi:Serine dehydrogenase proteinase
MSPLDLLWLFFIISSLQPLVQQQILTIRRAQGLRFPIDAELARSFNLKVSTDLPGEIRKLMSLYPQPRGRRPSVEYILIPYQAPAPRRDHTRRLPWRAR